MGTLLQRRPSAAGPAWAALLCVLITLLSPRRAAAWSCDEVPASLPAATSSGVSQPLSRLVRCAPEVQVPPHLQAAICSPDRASEVAPMPVSPCDDGELAAGPPSFDGVTAATAAPAEQTPSPSWPNQPPDAALAAVIDGLRLGPPYFAYEIHRRPNDTPVTPTCRRGVYRPPRR